MIRQTFIGVTVAAAMLLAGGSTSAQSTARSYEFSGYRWEVRRSNGLEGPGPNRFLDNKRTVWVDEEGSLHLKVWERLGAWFAAEVILERSLGYGTYVFETVGAIDEMDPPVILGMFTYDRDPAYDHREIDIEYGRFGASEGPNAQFVLQPFDVAGNRDQFSAQLDGVYTTHAFQWTPDQIVFASFHGHRAATLSNGSMEDPGDAFLIRRWTYSGSVPPPGNAQTRINLWLYEGRKPTREHEVVIRSFTFIPPSDTEN